MRTTPQRTPTTAPSLDVAKLNGGVPWIPAEWRHRSDPVIPESMVERITSRRSTLRTQPALREEALPRPRAQRMCRGVHTESSADRSEMGKIDRSRRRRGCAGAPRHKICTASLDTGPLIDASVSSDRSAQGRSQAKPDEVVQTPVARLSGRDASRVTNAYAVRVTEIVPTH